MLNKKSVIILTSLVFLVFIIYSLQIQILNQRYIEERIFNDVLFLDNDKTNPSELKPQVNKNKDYKIMPLKDNWKRPLSPVFTIISDEFSFTDEKNSPGIRVTTYELSRDSIFELYFDFPSLPKYSVTKNMSFEDVADLVSKYDITKDFPGKENYDIVNYSPLSQSDIDRNKQRLETEKQREAELKQAEETWNNMTPQEKIQYIQEKIQKYTASREEIINKYGEEGYNMEIKTLQDQIDEIKKENGLN